ncbi:MAG: hypothetical protein MZV63_41230 [Marinilabiliales bacterium]|nr:hypothetical protein [Marinilabiliales bacterium]
MRLFLVDTLPEGHGIMTGAAFVKVGDTLEAPRPRRQNERRLPEERSLQ